MANADNSVQEIMEFVKAHQADKFTGGESENVRQWLNWVDAGLELYNWSDAVKYKLAVHVVSKDVWAVIDALMPGQGRTWSMFKATLLAQYGHEQSSHYLRLLDELHQPPDMSVAAYSAKYLELAVAAGVARYRPAGPRVCSTPSLIRRAPALSRAAIKVRDV